MRALPLLALLLVGCGGVPSAVVDADFRAGTAIHEADAVLDAHLTTAGGEAIAAARADGSGFDGYARRMAPWASAVTALDTARLAWLAADRALSAWQAGDDGSQAAFMRLAACCVGALSAAVRALSETGVDVPASLREAADGLSGIAGALCADGGAQGESARGGVQ